MTKRTFLFSCFLILLFSLSAQTISITTDHTQLVLKVSQQKRLYQTYLGERLSSQTDLSQLSMPQAGLSSSCIRGFEVYPVMGTEDYYEPTFEIRHADGNPTSVLKYQQHSQQGDVTSITLRDEVYPVEVTLYYKVYAREDVIQQWAEIRHEEKGKVWLGRYASSMLYFEAPNYYLTEFASDWAKEMQMQSQELQFGKKVVDSRLGTRANLMAQPFFEVGLGGPVRENEGTVLMGTLGWTGNFRFTFEVDNQHVLRVVSGINHDASTYLLRKGDVFRTADFFFTLSQNGSGEGSRRFQRWMMNHQLHKAKDDRMTLLNNWENTYFDFNEEKLVSLFGEAKDLGVDLFLLDDGWFGNKYPRKDDHAGLGDWQVTQDKLPKGIPYLVKKAKENGVAFGIWIEPEMVNPKSELAEKHPDWLIQLPSREPYYFRNQQVLDLCNPKVQDYVFSITDNLLTENPEIAYIKWDCNADIMNYGSLYLPKNRQSEIYIRYHMGLRRVLERIRAKYPDVVIQVCASGGGRVTYGLLPWFDEFWTSDNTDAYQRIFIQWGDSHFYPAIAQASHVSASPNHQTRRELPIKFRFDVAMTGRLGMELQPKDMTDQEKAFAKRAIAAYKTIRPVVQQGDQYRLISPYDRGASAAPMYVNEEKTHAAVFAYRIDYLNGQPMPKVRLDGVDENRNYRIKDLTPQDEKRPCDLDGKVVSGRILKYAGLNVSGALRRPWSSVALELTAE